MENTLPLPKHHKLDNCLQEVTNQPGSFAHNLIFKWPYMKLIIFICNTASGSTSWKRDTKPLILSPKTKKIKKLAKRLNGFRCSLFREKTKLLTCFCNEQKVTSRSGQLKPILKQAKALLSPDAYVLFSHELQMAYTNKYNRRYTDEMKQLCLVWYYSSPKGYRVIAKTLSLPTPRTLKKWAANMTVSPGVNELVLNSIKNRFKNVDNNTEKFATLIFDEISIKEELQYNEKKDKIIGVVDNGITRKNVTSKSVLVCMARGIAHNWRYVLGYWFLGGSETASNMHKIVMSSIDKASEAGLLIKAVVCDQGPCNQGLARNLGVSTMRTYFKYKDQNIYFIYIVKVVESRHPLRVRLVPKVGTEHLLLSNFSAMKVKYAV